MIHIPAGEFVMGSRDFYMEEQPEHVVRLDEFWMDPCPVTVEQFAAFVQQTGYVTVAEKDLNAADYPGIAAEDLAAGSLVFTQSHAPVNLNNPANWWRFVKGAHWREPQQTDPPDSFQQHPVVHIAFEDASAYADWAGKRLPTEAEWEYACRGGLDRTAYPWGNEFRPDNKVMANTWDGEFPWLNNAPPDQTRTTPVATFAANGFGLYDMVGNVWEWTRDWWSSTHPVTAESACCAPARSDHAARGTAEASYDATQPEILIPRKVLKGGSHLCAANYCLRYRPAARIPQMIDSGTSHIGFRCIRQ
jgi:formylglycine-generating enzyme required for sulfatase activity